MGCVEAFIEQAKGTEGVGIVGIVTGIILFMAAAGAIPLCSDYAKDSAGF